MEWCTEYVNQMKWTIKTTVKWDVHVFLFAFNGPLLAIIGHYCQHWLLLTFLSNYDQIVYAQMFHSLQNIHNSEIRCRSVLTFVSLSLIRCNSLSVVVSSWLSCRWLKAMSLVGIYPLQGLINDTNATFFLIIPHFKAIFDLLQTNVRTIHLCCQISQNYLKRSCIIA